MFLYIILWVVYKTLNKLRKKNLKKKIQKN